MSDLWEFSPSSLPLLQRCVQVATQPDPQWLKLFNLDEISTDHEDSVQHEASVMPGAFQMDVDCDKIMNYPDSHIQESVPEVKEDAERISGKEFKQICEKIEKDAIVKFESYSEKLIEDQYLLPALAQKLSTTSIEKICTNILDNTNINPTLLTIFYTNFLPVYFKRESACIFLELLFNAHKTRPDLSKALIGALLLDTDMPSLRVFKLLEDFFNVLDHSAVLQYTELLQIELTREAFVHHIQTMLNLYKISTKTEQLQEAVLKLLDDASTLCEDDKNYGRFLNNFLQAQKNLGAPKNKGMLEKIVATHKSPFKRPCLAILNQL